jgi:hypothetical protein
MKRWALGVLAAFTCPCHLPIVLALLGSTAIGGALAAHQLWIFAAMSLIFTGAIAGLLLGRRDSGAGVEPAHLSDDELSEERAQSCCAPAWLTTSMPSAQREERGDG